MILQASLLRLLLTVYADISLFCHYNLVGNFSPDCLLNIDESGVGCLLFVSAESVLTVFCVVFEQWEVGEFSVKETRLMRVRRLKYTSYLNNLVARGFDCYGNEGALLFFILKCYFSFIAALKLFLKKYSCITYLGTCYCLRDNYKKQYENLLMRFLHTHMNYLECKIIITAVDALSCDAPRRSACILHTSCLATYFYNFLGTYPHYDTIELSLLINPEICNYYLKIQKIMFNIHCRAFELWRSSPGVVSLLNPITTSYYYSTHEWFVSFAQFLSNCLLVIFFSIYTFSVLTLLK